MAAVSFEQRDSTVYLPVGTDGLRLDPIEVKSRQDGVAAGSLACGIYALLAHYVFIEPIDSQLNLGLVAMILPSAFIVMRRPTIQRLFVRVCLSTALIFAYQRWFLPSSISAYHIALHYASAIMFWIALMSLVMVVLQTVKGAWRNTLSFLAEPKVPFSLSRFDG